ncbi:MAG TPA: hypothetical protein PLX45_23395 [Piscinibacter sp.]|nr:hypothetical protein [Piscinibacter sp.]HNW64274.1 hypothetical protein [Piscinibacter sp.]HPM69230.1 hypothetical protein [Piscinibacter sp.]
MHAFNTHSCDLPALRAPMAFATDPPVPWRAVPHLQGAAEVGTPDRAAEQWVWQSRFGPIVIEVRGKDVFVNGDRVAPHAP